MKKDLFTEAPVPEAYLKLAMPVVLSMAVSLIYNMVDTYFISLTGDTNIIAGISLCAPIFTLFIALGDIFGLGGSSVISRLLGGGDREKARSLSSACFWASIALGVVVTLLMLCLRGPILGLLGADSETWEYASQYYTWLVSGAAFVIFSLVPSNLLRTEGAAVQSMTGSVMGAVINMVLDPIFIFTFGLGAAGAAIASVIGNMATCAYYVVYMTRAKLNLTMDPRQAKVTRKDAVNVAQIGLPASVNNFMQTFGLMLTNRFLLPYGNQNIAAMGIALKVVNIAALVMVGLAFGGQPLLGYSYGAGDMKKFKKVLSFGLILNVCTGLVFALVLSLAARPVTGIFLKDDELIGLGARMMRLLLAGMPLFGACLIATCCFQSAGKALPAFLLSICRQGVVYAAVIAIMNAAFKLTGVIASQAVTDVITVLIAFALFRNSFRQDKIL